MDKLSAKICVPFGAETMENDPCTVGTVRDYTAGTGNRQTSGQVKERNRKAFQRRMAQKTSRIHVAGQETSQISGAEQKTSCAMPIEDVRKHHAAALFKSIIAELWILLACS